MDGQKLGRVPPQNRYTLAAGEHDVELRNPNLPHYRQKLTVPGGGVLSHTADFTATTAQSGAPTAP